MATVYVTAADMIQAYDARTIGQLVSDDDRELTPTELLVPDANLLFAMENAEAEAHAKLIQGGRYTAAQLAAVTGHPKNLLRSIIVKIAMRNLFDRRPMLQSDAKDYMYDQCQKALERIRRGEDVLDLTPDDQSDDANMPETVKETPRTVIARNSIVDQCRGRFYPEENFQSPFNN